MPSPIVSSHALTSLHDAALSAALRAKRPTVWPNPQRQPTAQALRRSRFTRADVEAAVARWQQFAPLLVRLFPELAASAGAIDSELLAVPEPVASALLGRPAGCLLIKADHALPLTGCIKARGGVFEVLVHAQTLALAAGLLPPGASSAVLAEAPARQLFAQHRIVVGSTGNLGFSVGFMARALGFEMEVHMSSDAKEWKKARLRQLGAEVVEHAQDYGMAVASARAGAAARAHCYFVDDEDSVELFMGYAAAAFDLQRQLAQHGVAVDAAHPLIVLLPCGVGGAPGGVSFGLKLLYGDAVQCVFVEPVASPCMLVQLAAGTASPVSVYDVGLDNRTAADGLAVAQASMLVARTLEHLLDAVVTVADEDLFRVAAELYTQMGLRLEPSAAAGFVAVAPYLDAVGPIAGEPTVVVWTTGGALLPDAEFAAVLQRAHALGGRG
jgi:D-serine dehydratase